VLFVDLTLVDKSVIFLSVTSCFLEIVHDVKVVEISRTRDRAVTARMRLSLILSDHGSFVFILIIHNQASKFYRLVKFILSS